MNENIATLQKRSRMRRRRGDFDVDLQQLKFPIVGSWN
jgi:hypothetical protein